MPFGPTRAGRRHDETAYVVRHFQKTISRVLNFLGYTIDDVVNDPEKRTHVRRLGKLSLRIERDLATEPWRTEATGPLASGSAGAVQRRPAEARGAASRSRPPSEAMPSGR